ncbi:hypothetical protein GCM10025868_16180 [Angustibacter aerolatus]|uniref:Uncharacterized protein n=1 Tax=Angustibacter aerolatus TaxID=1162965 RepID=A0ABQ6JDY3_9ACTN|nr:hypothetical protein GCM10025868_16180 [Angustibacter aerolatus]
MDDMAMAADPEASEASEQYLRGVTQVYAQRVQSAMDEPAVPAAAVAGPRHAERPGACG